MGALLEELHGALEYSPPTLIDIAGSRSDHVTHTMERTFTLEAPSDWAETIGREYAACRYVVLDNRAKPGPKVTLTIGRSRSSDIVIGTPSVSKHHATAVVDRVSGEVTLSDEGSRNGTYVNEKRLQPHERVLIWSGTRVRFGAAGFLFLDPDTLRKLAAATRRSAEKGTS